MPDDDVLAAWGIATLGPVDTKPVADAIRRAARRDAERWYRPPQPACSSEAVMGDQFHKLHSNPYYTFDPHRGQTPIDVTRAGEHYETLVLSGGPSTALAKARSEYERMAAIGGRDPGLWRFTARAPDAPSVELLVPERQNADSGAVEGGTARSAVSSGVPRPGNRIGRSSPLLGGLRPRGFCS